MQKELLDLSCVEGSVTLSRFPQMPKHFILSLFILDLLSMIKQKKKEEKTFRYRLTQLLCDMCHML